ncbi:RAxF-45 family protein [Bacillus chungangensis]|uniref:Uncharacterized protein n=1 Tax=Bacillus chungangensis TaxID=587633 RepID=A0ABT9WVC7_9BACI|nr:RAxF-45 family protein [Bacillus chungangensis]MDQ0177250.1 hypothetical protein [Bacillus chungangensis]
MSQAVIARVQWIEFLYIRRAIFSVVIANGTSVPFFNNIIWK